MDVLIMISGLAILLLLLGVFLVWQAHALRSVHRDRSVNVTDVLPPSPVENIKSATIDARRTQVRVERQMDQFETIRTGRRG